MLRGLGKPSPFETRKNLQFKELNVIDENIEFHEKRNPYAEDFKKPGEEEQTVKNKILDEKISALEQLVIVIDRPKTPLAFMMKLLVFGLSAAVCTVGVNALYESRRRRKEAVDEYLKHKHSAPLGGPVNTQNSAPMSQGIPAVQPATLGSSKISSTAA